MTNEVATRTDTPPRLPALQSGGQVRPIVPQDFDGAWRIANAVVKAGMAPKEFDTAEKAMVAILHGLEVGMTPMAALQSIAIVNGRPTIWGDGALALVRGSGKLEHFNEWIEGDGDQRIAVCEVKRKGDPTAIRRTFSVHDAKIAKLWEKAGPWSQYPNRMLQMRARAFALRDGFADVLRGLGIAEEVGDYAATPDATPPAPPQPPAPPAPPSYQSAKAEASQPQVGQTEVVDAEFEDVAGQPAAQKEEFDPNELLSSLESALEQASDEATIEEIWTEHDLMARFEVVENGEHYQTIANAIKARFLKKVKGNG